MNVLRAGATSQRPRGRAVRDKTAEAGTMSPAPPSERLSLALLPALSFQEG